MEVFKITIFCNFTPKNLKVKMIRLSYFFIALLFVSCDYFQKSNKNQKQDLDTIINLKKVDTSPYFEDCKHLIDQEKTNCFRQVMQRKITNLLQNYSDISTISIDKKVILFLKIDKKGKVSISDIKPSEFIEKNIPNFENYIKKSVDSLPKLYPALKRGIPVTTQYKMPIHIKTN